MMRFKRQFDLSFSSNAARVANPRERPVHVFCTSSSTFGILESSQMALIRRLFRSSNKADIQIAKNYGIFFLVVTIAIVVKHHQASCPASFL